MSVPDGSDSETVTPRRAFCSPTTPRTAATTATTPGGAAAAAAALVDQSDGLKSAEDKVVEMVVDAADAEMNVSQRDRERESW